MYHYILKQEKFFSRCWTVETVQAMSFEVGLKFTALFSLLLLNLLAWTTGEGEYVLNIFILLRKTEKKHEKKEKHSYF